jgi:plasmid maintenance system killer protein
MIRSFASRDTEELFSGGAPRRFGSFRAQAERKLQMLDSAKDLNDLRVPRVIGWRSWVATGGDSTVSESTISGESASAGEMTVLGT